MSALQSTSAPVTMASTAQNCHFCTTKWPIPDRTSTEGLLALLSKSAGLPPSSRWVAPTRKTRWASTFELVGGPKLDPSAQDGKKSKFASAKMAFSKNTKPAKQNKNQRQDANGRRPVSGSCFVGPAWYF